MIKNPEAEQLFDNIRQAVAKDLQTQIGTVEYRNGLSRFAVNNIAQSGRNDLCYYAFNELFGMALKQPSPDCTATADVCATMALRYAAQHVDESEWPSLIAPAEEYLHLMKDAGVQPQKDFYKLLAIICNKQFMEYTVSEHRSDIIVAANAEKVYRYACLGASSVDEFKGSMAYGGVMMAIMELNAIKGQQYIKELQQQIVNEGGTIIAGDIVKDQPTAPTQSSQTPSPPSKNSSSQQQQTISTKSGGCYVATAVYGSYDCPEVWVLRRYRDYNLSTNWLGRMFIRCYYALSPRLVRHFGKTKWFNRFFKARLDNFVNKLKAQGFNDEVYWD